MLKPWQLLREWPPGYGGVERVAHQLASTWQETVYSLNAKPEERLKRDPIAATYQRSVLPRVMLGKLIAPLPSRAIWTLLMSSHPLHGHLPCPAVLLLLFLAKVIHPCRKVSAHWHSFLEAHHSLEGRLYGWYQKLALFLLPWFDQVITTSPDLAFELQRCGCPASQVAVLHCCLDASQEEAALAIPDRNTGKESPLRLLFIGRLDSYKRLDWLMESLTYVSHPWSLDVVGDGPRRSLFERQAIKLFARAGEELLNGGAEVRFYGRVNEDDKLRCLANSDVLVLPADRSNEAFGIAQLEAMASGIPALAFRCHQSGMGWVGRLNGLQWSQTPEELSQVIQVLAEDPALRRRLGCEARSRYKQLFGRVSWEQKLSQLC